MPCYRCGARQTDPERGPSPWKRGVARPGVVRPGTREHQVLVCPACQRQADWAAGLQSCARCGSLHLIRRLDQVECLDCRLVRDADPGQDPPPGGPLPGSIISAESASGSRSPALAEEVARALDRVLHSVSPGGRPPGPPDTGAL